MSGPEEMVPWRYACDRCAMERIVHAHRYYQARVPDGWSEEREQPSHGSRRWHYCPRCTAIRTAPATPSPEDTTR